jgi:hypothetical protein
MEKKTMKHMLNITLSIALFAGTIVADGQMGSGGCNGESCPPPPPPPCTENCNRPIEADGESLIDKIVKEIVTSYFSRK